jgi:thioredoxin reductase
MSTHASPTPSVERVCDVAIVGGSAAGLAAALQLGRQRRSVIVIDAGEPRNAPAAHMHSYLGHEGVPPDEFTAITREEVRSYGVEVLPARAVDVTRLPDGDFRIELTGGHAVIARRVVAATGIVDELPDIDGLAEHWGRDVIHCPFCHGYEVRDRRIVQIVTHPMGLHPAGLYRRLTDRLTLVLHDGVAPDAAELDALRASGVRVVADRVERIVSDDNGRLAAVGLVGGEQIDADAVAVGPRFRPRTDAFTSVGLVPVAHASGLGECVETSPAGLTSVPGLYAAGNVTDPSQQVLAAAADGSWVGAMISFDLAQDDLATARRPSANEADWDHRYRGDRMWSGNPNGSLVHEVTGMAPGRALDVGAGEGGDALWLGSEGWQVTASDISQRGLDQVAAEAERRGVTVACLHADANDLDPFGDDTFDLVTAHYASIPRTPDRRAIGNMLAAVAPGGTLLVVGHDLAPMRRPVDTSTHSRMYDADAYVTVDAVAATLAESPGWHVEVHELRSRPPGHASASHHVDDVVLRARRIGV